MVGHITPLLVMELFYTAISVHSIMDIYIHSLNSV